MSATTTPCRSRKCHRAARVAVAGAAMLALAGTAGPAVAATGPARPAPSPAAAASAVPTATLNPAATLPAWLRGRDWERIPTKKHVVALTFDAGSNAAGVPAIRHTLQARGVRATFFLTGQWARTYPVKAKAIAGSFRIGNHSLTHPHFTRLTNAQIRSQLSRAQQAIVDVCGVSPRPLFRFPFGDRNARTITAVNNAGYVPVRWTVDTLGWEGTSSGITVNSIVRRVVNNLVPGEIVLMHVGANPDDHSTLDADALPRVITALRRHGYSFVTLNALLAARS